MWMIPTVYCVIVWYYMYVVYRDLIVSTDRRLKTKLKRWACYVFAPLKLPLSIISTPLQVKGIMAWFLGERVYVKRFHIPGVNNHECVAYLSWSGAKPTYDGSFEGLSLYNLRIVRALRSLDPHITKCRLTLDDHLLTYVRDCYGDWRLNSCPNFELCADTGKEAEAKI